MQTTLILFLHLHLFVLRQSLQTEAHQRPDSEFYWIARKKLLLIVIFCVCYYKRHFQCRLCTTNKLTCHALVFAVAHRKKFTTNRFVQLLTWNVIKSTFETLKANGMFPRRCQPRCNERIKFNDTRILHEYAVKGKIIFKNVTPCLRYAAHLLVCSVIQV